MKVSMKLSELTQLNEVADLFPKSISDHIEQKYIGKYVLVRTLASGVHFGKAVIYESAINHIILEDARRLYSYVDRFTLSEVSQQGVTDKALMSVSIPDIMICDVIEVMSVSPEAEAKLQELKTHVVETYKIAAAFATGVVSEV